ncbi:MAG: hypothetical protein AAFX80_08280 [Cyanobacteria bacterium J06639_18]
MGLGIRDWRSAIGDWGLGSSDKDLSLRPERSVGKNLTDFGLVPSNLVVTDKISNG